MGTDLQRIKTLFPLIYPVFSLRFTNCVVTSLVQILYILRRRLCLRRSLFRDEEANKLEGKVEGEDQKKS